MWHTQVTIGLVWGYLKMKMANKNHWQNKGQDGENLQKTDGQKSVCAWAQSTKMHEAMRPYFIFLIQKFHENHIPFLFQFSQMNLLPLVKFLVLMARSMKTACLLSVLQAPIYKREFLKHMLIFVYLPSWNTGIHVSLHMTSQQLYLLFQE